MLRITVERFDIVMYKDDNMISCGCNDALLRTVLGNKAGCGPDLASEGNEYYKNSCKLYQKANENCSCENQYDSWGIANYPLASVFAPLQEFEELYDLEKSLKQGTMFSKLDLPFMGTTIKGGNFRD